MPEQPLIVCAGIDQIAKRDWVLTIESTFADDYRFAYIDSRDNYISRLVDDYVSLILVDGGVADWQFWTATPKSNPATRRIPVFVMSAESTIRQQALTSGADIALSPSELTRTAKKLFTDFARVFDPERAEQLDCDCQEALPELARQGMEKFNAGEYYKQHDLFEELWVKTESPVRDLYRAILQVGVAYYQIQRGNHRGARKMLLRSVQWLMILPDVCQGIDVRALREDSARVRAELEQLDEADINQFDMTLIQPLKTVDA